MCDSEGHIHLSVCLCVRFAGRLCLTSVINEQKQKHIRIEVAMTTDQLQQRRDQQLADRLVCEFTLTPTTATTHPFNGPFSGTTRVGRYQKGKTNLDFTEARDSEWQCHQLGHMQVCTSLQTDYHASTPPLSFLQAGCPSYCPTNSVKALKALLLQSFNDLFSRTTWVSWYQKGKTSLDFYEARDEGVLGC